MPRILEAVVACLVVTMSLCSAAAAALRVDVSLDNGRRDVLSRTGHNWVVPDGKTASTTIGELEFGLRAVGSDSATLVGEWWKPGLDYSAEMATDGVVVDGAEDGAIELIIRGLSAGRHTLTTYHNWLADSPAGPVIVEIDGQSVQGRVRPSHRVTDDYDAAAVHLAFDAADGKDVRVRIRPDTDDSTARAILNGFEIDASDPSRRAARPSPANGDEHAPEVPTLTWSAVPDAAGYRVYLGTDRAAVERATPDSPEHRGQVSQPSYQAEGLSHMDEYFWRVDSLDSAGQVLAQGQVWRFRTRHLAFPGAEGYGRFARGGRGGRVIEVTNLEDSGPGSLRAAVEADGPRTVVFRVGGTIQLKNKLIIRNPYITIAGQTAPGDGIAVAGYTFGCLGTHDVIMRYVRIRVGDMAGQTMDGTGFASTDHAIYDHCSISWSIDEAVSSRGAGNITLQRCIVAEALNVAGHSNYAQGKGHSYAGSISGNIGSFHHNLVAHCAGRNWSMAGGLTKGGKFAGYLDIRNNVVYNWVHRTTDGGVRKANFVGNYYIPGPATRKDVRHFVKAQLELKLPDDIQQYYVADNVMEGHPEYTGVKYGGLIFQHATEEEQRRMVLDAPFCEPHITVHTPEEAYESVMADVGANLPRYDAVDQRILRDVKERSFTFRGSRTGLPGIIDSQKDVGGFPKLRNGRAPADEDHDGMADSWERANGLDPTNPEDGNLLSEDGYTQLEKYLNWIVENGGLPQE